jgi:hypothetical protein
MFIPPNHRLLMEDLDGERFVLLARLVYHSEALNMSWSIPEGFQTDLASIPRLLWALLPKTGAYDRAAVVHDYLYFHNGVTRGQADGVLREAMKDLGVSWITRQTIWAGVRSGGWVPWNRYRSKETK